MKIEEVKISEGRREVNQDKVKALSESIKELGLLNPITVNTDNTLIAGMHRIEACKLLGWDNIPANTINLSSLLAELAEIDENLIRNELHWTDADKQTARRKAIYLELHPDTKAGLSQALSMNNKLNNVSDNLSPTLKTFTEDTASKTGKSERTIERSVKRGIEITEDEAEVLKKIDAPKSAGDLLIKQVPEVRKKVIEKAKETDKPLHQVIEEIKKVEKKENFERKQNEFNQEIKPINTKQKIILGDSREVLKTLQPNSFDLLLSDPPYGMDFKSGWNTQEKIENDKIEDTISLFEDVLKLSVPLLKDDAHFYLFGNINFMPQIKPIIEKYLTLKNVLIWDRQVIGMGDLKSYGNSYDVVYFGFNKTWKDLNGTRDRDLLSFKRVDPSKNIHPTEKPIEILEYLLKKSSNEGDNILEPFAGGGSTLKACKNTNRIATGIEIEKKYFELIKSRI